MESILQGVGRWIRAMRGSYLEVGSAPERRTADHPESAREDRSPHTLNMYR